ncbi:MAG TPA: T9SS type A sorting domain-containing protein [Bacteroidia bacterium]|jgi:hypothetical protein|nr:T9SS type A sorting domain-containing protein [Bacteroidia bacterium]
MKKLYIILPLLCFTIKIKMFAQSPILTAANSNPVIGEVINGQGINYTSPGSGGASQVWNFSALVSTGAQSFSFIDPSTTANAASFPTSNIATFNSAASSYNYLTTSSTSLLADGNFTSPSTLMPYSNPQKVLDYPFSMGSNFTDTYQGSYTSGSSTIIRKGTDTVTADGYGSLILPYGTLNNVLRASIIDNYADTTTLGVPFAKFRTVTYNWYLPNIHYPVMSLTSIYYNGNPVAQFGSYLDQTSTSIGIIEHDLLNSNLSIYPNPATNSLFIQAAGKIKTITCTNYLGQAADVKFENNSVNISSFSKGLYFLTVTSEDGKTNTQKFIKE